MAKTAKKAPAQKKAPAKKAAAKPLMASPKKPAKPKMSKIVPQSSEPDNFMTRMLKKKEAERLEREKAAKNSKFDMHASNNQLPSGSQGITRFHGPRRKAV